MAVKAAEGSSFSDAEPVLIKAVVQVVELTDEHPEASGASETLRVRAFGGSVTCLLAERLILDRLAPLRQPQV